MIFIIIIGNVFRRMRVRGARVFKTNIKYNIITNIKNNLLLDTYARVKIFRFEVT